MWRSSTKSREWKHGHDDDDNDIVDNDYGDDL